MKTKPASLLLVLALTACGAGPGSDPGTTAGTSPQATAPGSALDGPMVTITATPVALDDGTVELCPPGMTGKCPGIIFEGELPDELLSSEESPTFVRATGRYDGRRVVATTEPEGIAYPPAAEVDFSSLCPDLKGTASVNPDDRLTQALSEYVALEPDYAAMWWDRDSAVMTVWFVGDEVSAHQAAIADLADGEPVCVAGGATYSEAELMEAAELLGGITDSRGLPRATFGYGVGGLSNRIELPLEELDAETRNAIADLTGDRVVPYPYLEMSDQPLSELPEPVPAVEGDVDLLTSRVRQGGGMDALGRFEVSYDAGLNCVYFPGSEEGGSGRTVPVWPFGYSATSSPLIIYDYDGETVATEGEEIELGGGFVGADFVEGNACDAEGAWIVNG